MMLFIIVAALFGYEYYRREQRHHLVIESLKRGSLPRADILPESTGGAVAAGFFTVVVIVFVLFLSYFVFLSGKMTIPQPYVILPVLFLLPLYGIAVLLVLITKRNILQRKKQDIAKERIAS